MRRWLTIALPAGRYRLGKSVMDFRSAGDYDQRDYYAVFSLAQRGPGGRRPLGIAQLGI